MKKIIIAVLIAAVAGGLYYSFSKKEKSEEKKYARVKAEYGYISEFVETTGQVEPLNRVEILPPSSGRIEKIFIEEGANVKAGDVLALMSSQDRVAILDSARAIGEKEYETWQDAYKPIKIIAPISGRVILRNIVEGQTVGASTVLFAMSDMLITVASVDESDIGKIKTGQTAMVTLDAYPEKTVRGRVFQILDEGKSSNNVIIYKAKIRLENIPYFFKSQMTANIKIQISSGKKALLLDTQAVNYSKDGKPYVIKSFDRKKNPVETYINTGKEYEGKTEIKSGLEDGEEVFMEVKAYRAQDKSDSASSPFMPKRPTGKSRNAMRAVR